MSLRLQLIGLLALMAAGGTAVYFGKPDNRVGLGSLNELFGDAARDAEQPGLRLTRVSDSDEMALGNRVATQLPPDSSEQAWTTYVDAVGQSLAGRATRRGIRYQFHVIDGPQVNAFAIPGGHVYIYTGMLELLASEAELAAVLGHEISHIDLRHCIERYQYELKLERVGAREIGSLVNLARLPFTIGYAKYQELDADAQGMRLATQAGYDPRAAAEVFARMARKFGERPKPDAVTPAGEAANAALEALGGYFRSHPHSSDRQARLEEQAKEAGARLAGTKLYRGTENYRLRSPKSVTWIPEEEVVLAR